MATANYQLPQPNGTWYEVSKNNVALTCAGIALETAYKAILLADGRSRYNGEQRPYQEDMPYTHDVRTLHSKLRNDRRAAVDSQIESIYGGKRTPALEGYFRLIDEYINHSYRRYWFMGASTVGGVGRGVLENMHAIHRVLMEQTENAWSELQSEYSAATSKLRALAERMPAVYDVRE